MDATKNERRIAKNGKAYTYKEFAAYYNSQILFAMWQEAAVLNSAEQPANTDGSSIPEGQDARLSREELAAAARPVDTIAGRPEDNVEQPASRVCLTTHEARTLTFHRTTNLRLLHSPSTQLQAALRTVLNSLSGQSA